MKSLALFKPTFQKTQSAINLVQNIKEKALPRANKYIPLQRLSRAMLIFNSIEHNAMDLQTAEVDNQLSRFANFLNIKNMTVSYDYQGKGFQLVRNSPVNEKITKLSLHLRSLSVQKVDHPILRQSLYFHELKDIDQIVKIKYPRHAPRFVRQIYRKTAENNLLDSQNPLGVPMNAPPLQFILKINDLFAVQLYCRYGNINIRSIRMLKQELNDSGQPQQICDYLLHGMNIPRPIQKILYNIVQKQLEFDEPELLLLHKIAYIGGRVEQLQFLFNMLEIYTAAIDIP